MTGPAITTRDGRRHAALSLDIDGTLYAVGARFVLRALFIPGGLRTFLLIRRARDVLRDRTFASGAELRQALVAELAAQARMQPGDARTLLERPVRELWARVLPGLAPRGLPAALTSLRDAGVKLVAFSDHEPQSKLEALGVAALFDVVVGAEEEGAYKPHPAGFQAVQRALALPPSAILHAGDRQDTDVAGARRAGWDAVLVGAGDGPGAVRDVSDLARRMLLAPR